VWNSPKLPVVAITSMPSAMMRSTPVRRLSRSMVFVAWRSAASGVANAGIMPITPCKSCAVIMACSLLVWVARG